MSAAPARPPAEAQIAALLVRIDANADPLHADITPAVQALVAAGWPAARGLLDLMMASGEHTRMHAQRALEGILMAEFGFVPGRGFSRASGEEGFRARWRTLGDYAWDAPADHRAQAVMAWRHWLDARDGRPSP
jgi:hypothetical protein